MSPTLSGGDWILCTYRPGGLSRRVLAGSIGKIVLVRRRAEPDLLTIKRLMKELDTGYWVEGDDAKASTDSRNYLTIAGEEIVGRYLMRYRRGPSTGLS